MKNYLNFETDIKELETEIEKLKDPFNQSGVSEVETQKISKIQSELDEKLEMIYSDLGYYINHTSLIIFIIFCCLFNLPCN